MSSHPQLLQNPDQYDKELEFAHRSVEVRPSSGLARSIATVHDRTIQISETSDEGH